MDFYQKTVYHQVHPLKLVANWMSRLAAAWLLWRQHLALGLAVGIITPVLVSAVILRLADLERYRTSRFGRYVARHGTTTMGWLNLWGVACFWVGAWYHAALLIIIGLVVNVFTWVRGLIWPGSSTDPAA